MRNQIERATTECDRRLQADLYLGGMFHRTFYFDSMLDAEYCLDGFIVGWRDKTTTKHLRHIDVMEIRI